MVSKAIEIISAILGWTYVVAWTISFYPQAIMNFKRKSVSGLSIDFVVASVIGFGSYSIYTVALFFVPKVRREYRDTHNGNDNLVQINDVFFAVHALILTTVYLIQVVLYKKKEEKVSKMGVASTVVVILLSVILAALCVFNKFSWLNFVYVMSYIKLATTVLKYIPQVYMNYVLKSTVGWNVNNVILDFIGGVLSIVQLLLDAFNMDDLSGIKGTSAKLILGLVSIIFDVIFMLQHYVWYRETPHQRVLVENTKTSELSSPLPTAGDSTKGHGAPFKVEIGTGEPEAQRNNVEPATLN